VNRRYRGNGSVQSNESNAEYRLTKVLQHLKNKGLLDDIGLTQRRFPVKYRDGEGFWHLYEGPLYASENGIPGCFLVCTEPDRYWPLNAKHPTTALYLDGDEVHPEDDPWDAEVNSYLRSRGWNILRERYHAPISNRRLMEIVTNICGALDEEVKVPMEVIASVK
jgi:hypothetical protein